MNRSIKKKAPFVSPKLLNKVNTWIANGKPKEFVIRTWARSSEIQPSFIGCKFEVHNGKDFTLFVVTKHMVGFKLGAFSLTRKYAGINHKKVKTKAVQSRH